MSRAPAACPWVDPLVTRPLAASTMSFSLSAAQYESAFEAKRLCNWETPAYRLVDPPTRPPGFRTEIIVDNNGHIIKGVPKRMTSFTTGYEGMSPKRWPVSPSAPFSGVATMGYKGIQTDYLPTTTVYLRNNPDTDEFTVCRNFALPESCQSCSLPQSKLLPSPSHSPSNICHPKPSFLSNAHRLPMRAVPVSASPHPSMWQSVLKSHSPSPAAGLGALAAQSMASSNCDRRV